MSVSDIEQNLFSGEGCHEKEIVITYASSTVEFIIWGDDCDEELIVERAYQFSNFRYWA